MTNHAPVVHVVVAGEIGGAERMLVDLVQASRARHHTIALATPSDALRRFFLDAGLEVDDRGYAAEDTRAFLRRSLGLADVRWLGQVLRARRAGIVHLHTLGGQVLGTRAALANGARIVRTEHSTRVFDDPSAWPFARWSLRRAHASVAISAHVRDVALRKAPWARASMTVVPNGIPLDRFAPGPFPAADEPRPLRLVAVGRLDPRKGFDTALQAVAKVPGCELTIVGDGEARDSLEALVRELGIGERVTLVGHAPDVRPFVAEADVALSSARKEGLGIALLEAMAMGRPVIALPTGGVVEFVEDGVTGWLASGTTTTDLMAVVRTVVDGFQRIGHGTAPHALPGIAERGRLARALVERRYAVRAMAEGYERIYARL